MSGVYINGMQKPDHCLRCPMKKTDDDCVLQYPEMFDSWVEQMANCPLIPVSDHGKLIDADKLIARLERQRTVILHNLPEVHAMEEGYTKEDYIFERNGDMVSILRNQAGVIPSDMEDSKE